ncbi:MAG: site-specific integrase [Firmicutes bacterium]|nr:site-specific integrase [Bacillota bacterium]
MTVSMQVKNGFWYGVASYKDEVGTNKKKWFSTGLKERGNKKEAKEIVLQKLDLFEKELKEGKDKIERRGKQKNVDKSNTLKPFSDYCDKYIESIKDKVEAKTYSGYKGYMKRIREFFDKHNLRLIDVTEDEIKDFYDYLKSEGLKNVTIIKYADVLRPALRQAFKEKLIPDNPYEFMPSLSREKPTVAYYNQDEMAKLFEKLEGDRFELLIKLAGYYGLRRSELVGLKWNAVDFENKTISVNHKVLYVDGKIILSDKLKTKSSYRTLPLFAEIESLLLEKRAEVEDNMQFYGKSYNHEFSEYICVDDIGKLINPDVVTNNFKKILKKNNLKDIRLHDLRHSAASIMLANAVNLKQIQEWLGHGSFKTTADIYSHLDYSSKLQSANAMENALRSKASSTKVPKETKVDTKQTIEDILSQMAELGISDLSEYLQHIEKKETNTSKNESDYEM